MPTGSVTPAGGGTAFNGGTITTPLVIDGSARSDKVLRVLLPFSEEMYVNAGVNVVGFRDAGGALVLSVSDSSVTFGTSTFIASGFEAQDPHALAVLNAAGLFKVIDGTSGDSLFTVDRNGKVVSVPPAAATLTLVSGTGAQIQTDSDSRTYTPVTFNPTAGAAATCAVAISKDGTNYTALWTETEPAGIAFDGTIHGVNVYVPAAWKLRLTTTNATIGTTTYY